MRETMMRLMRERRRAMNNAARWRLRVELTPGESRADFWERSADDAERAMARALAGCEVRVEQRHIDAGRQRDCQRCPITLAIRDAIGVSVPVSVSQVIRYGDTDAIVRIGFSNATVRLPRRVARWIEAFDTGVEVRPFQFEISS